MSKSTDKLTRKQVLAIPVFLNQGYRGKIWTIVQVARRYQVSEQAIYYHIKKLRKQGIKIKVQKQGQRSVIYNDRYPENTSGNA